MNKIIFKIHDLYTRYREPLRRGLRTFVQGAMGALVIYGNAYVNKEQTDIKQLLFGALIGGLIAVWQNRDEALPPTPSEEEQDADPVLPEADDTGQVDGL